MCVNICSNILFVENIPRFRLVWIIFACSNFLEMAVCVHEQWLKLAVSYTLFDLISLGLLMRRRLLTAIPLFQVFWKPKYSKQWSYWHVTFGNSKELGRWLRFLESLKWLQLLKQLSWKRSKRQPTWPLTRRTECKAAGKRSRVTELLPF